MYHWIDQDSESNNVIVLTASTVFMGSCDNESIDQVAGQLTAKQNPIEVFGSDGLTAIPLIQIQSIVSRHTDSDVEIKYKAKKEIEDKSLYFTDVKEKEDFVSKLQPMLPDNLEKTEYRQSAFSAALGPFLSLVLAALLLYLFFDKFRWAAIGVGGLWLLGSLYMLYLRVSEPPVITRWVIRGKYARKMWAGLKTAFSFLVLAVIMLAIYGRFPDSHGPKSLFEHMEHEDLKAEDVTKFLSRGADLNYADKYGDTPLYRALNWNEDDLALALVEAGASLSPGPNGENPLEHAIYYDNNIKVVEAMLKRGAPLNFTIEDMTPLAYAQANDNAALVQLLSQYVSE